MEVVPVSRQKSVEEIVAKLKSLADPEAVEGMARYGISPKKTFGMSIPNLRKIAKETERDHGLALQLWDTGVREARTLAALF